MPFLLSAHVNETWFFHFQPDLRRQNMECRYRSPCSTQKFPVDTSARTRYIPFHFLARGRNLIGNMKPSGNGQ